jgi:urate oxidase
MIKKTIALMGLSVLTLSVSVSVSVSVYGDVPNTFTKGKKVIAAEVNENFISYSCKQSAGASISRTAAPQVPFDLLSRVETVP